MSRLYERALALGWTLVAIAAAVCVPLRLAEIHAAQHNPVAQPAVAAEQKPSLPHVQLARAED
ncbi:hypothetical protein [Xanthomonas vasicola]|uniref:hypothetical protein n=1 Tax=Xanthomonas vasicola TaxID=56459 RepID=UPI000531F885|nr:hypothetical protein [Xanthomonas vasicola]KGR38551.1 hypothetical protein NX04_20030 [Xanthomonas vasicola]RNK73328.1 hypothetical protein C9390_19030 [Xanthomonas vasicola pv. vasculorum]RNL01821.1 hypothetical protein C9407_15425 [Xanthomonas vasicola pv. vasculorum]TWQ40825.1 hypothetical protein FQJ96_04910 [Xanthomonas vasicola]TWQ61226.1 hypothetical protein FQJ93_02730 [Xanthomonas vasicola]